VQVSENRNHTSSDNGGQQYEGGGDEEFNPRSLNNRSQNNEVNFTQDLDDSRLDESQRLKSHSRN
jgi:hypothetical protein